MFPITIKQKMTAALYQRYSWSVLLQGKFLPIYIGVVEIGLIIYAILSFINESTTNLIVALLSMPFIPLVFLLIYYFQVKNVYKKNPTLRDTEQELTFYEDHLFAKNNQGEARYNYDEITKIIESKQDFYIMIAKNMGFVMEKIVCPPELQDFLREMKKQQN